MLQDAEPASLKERMTRDSWQMWNLFYAQDPWGELRADMRAAAMVINLNNPKSDVSMFCPYFEDDEVDDETRFQEGQAALAAIGPEAIQEALKRGRDKYLEAKAKRG